MSNILVYLIIAISVISLGLIVLIDRKIVDLGLKIRKSCIKEILLLIKNLNKGGTEPELAVINADRIFSKALSTKIDKKTLGEQLKSSKAYFKKEMYNQIWYGHKLRNRIVHDNLQIDKKTAISILNTYIKGIQAL